MMRILFSSSEPCRSIFNGSRAISPL
jgi:hypothetical protein